MQNSFSPPRPAVTLIATLLVFATNAWAAECPAFLNHDFKKLHSSESINICKAYAGRPLLLVNTASHCGYTPQFKGLEAIHEKYGNRGLVVIGFPSDDFNQEAPDQAETAQVCFVNYGVTFTMLAPQPVTGSAANAVFKELARQSRAPSWNFNKYLVSGDGRVVRYFDSSTPPDSVEFDSALEQFLH